MEKTFRIVEIKDENPIIEWGARLMGEFHNKALEAIKKENLKEETVFYVEIDGKKYLAFFSEGENVQPADMEMKINRKHKEIMTAIRIRSIKGTPVYSLEDPGT